MNINRIILTIIVLFPFVAYVIHPFLRWVPMAFLCLIIIAGILSNLTLRGGPKKPSKITIAYFFFVTYLSLLDFIRLQPYGAGYNLLFTLPMLYYIDQISISMTMKKKIDKYLIFLFYASLVTILIQQGFNVDFFVSPKWIENASTQDIYIQRLPSIYSWISSTAALFTFPPILSILIQEQLNKDSTKKAVSFLIIGLLIAFLTRGRSTVLYVLVISFQFIFFSGFRVSNYFRYTIIIVVFFIITYNLLIFFGLPIKEIFFFRFMEGGKDLESTTVFARISNFEFFFNNLKDFWLFGTGNEINEALAEEMDRRSNMMLIGILDPFFRYGILAFLMYIMFLFILIKRFYRTAKYSKSYGPFLGIIGYVVMNFTANSIHLFQIGLIILFIYEKYYHEQTMSAKYAELPTNRIKNKFKLKPSTIS